MHNLKKKISKHTPGPWESFKPNRASTHDGFSVAAQTPNRPDLIRIANVLFPGTVNEAEANARLIAAAPEMLKALKTISEYEDSGALTLRPRSDMRYESGNAIYDAVSWYRRFSKLVEEEHNETP